MFLKHYNIVDLRSVDIIQLNIDEPLKMFIVSTPLPLFWLGETNFSKTAAWGGVTIFAFRRGGGFVLGEAFAWGNSDFFLNIFVFVILQSFDSSGILVKKYVI